MFYYPDITLTQRLKILKTARTLASRSISYAPLSALLPKDWNGSLSEVEELRCDGFVELCYEINNVNVWGKFRKPTKTVTYSITDLTNNYDYDTFSGSYSTPPLKKWPDALEEHNDFDTPDWADTLQPATQCGKVKAPGEAQTMFVKNDLCFPVGTKGDKP
jgi:hypothetical protein